jgi:hypothetical protein
MHCPSCNGENPEEATECGACGIVFAKWKARQLDALLTPDEPAVVPRPTPLSSEPAPSEPDFAMLEKLAVPILVIVLVGSAFSYWSCTQEVDHGTQAALPDPTPESTDSPVGFDASRGLSRLEGILREINAEAEAYGVTVSLEDLRSGFERGAEPPNAALVASRAKDAGLSPPAVEEFSGSVENELSQSIGAKCWIDGEWRYRRELPDSGPEEGVTDCWKRQYGQNRTIAGDWMLVNSSWQPRWEHYTWQPNNRRWAAYTEDEERRVLETLIDEKYGTDAEQEDREYSRRSIESIERRPAAPEYQASNLKGAILSAYRTRVMREGALYRVEYERSRNR